MVTGMVADLLLGDPRRGHPVAGFGTTAAAVERFSYADNRPAGLGHTAVLLGLLGAGAALADRAARRRGTVISAALLAAATWAGIGGTTLVRTGERIADLLAAGDIDGAREVLPSLCGRDPAFLDQQGLTRAALESIAENTSDAQVAPMFWAMAAGTPGILLYRGTNTLDSMIGHRSPRYLRFGWAAARLDDIVNYPGARLAGVLTVLCAPLVGGSSAGAVRAWIADAARHPSPNAGVVEAAFAGALGVQLGGPTQYRHELQIRPRLGSGPAPGVADLRKALRLSRYVQIGATAVTTSVVLAAGRCQRRLP